MSLPASLSGRRFRCFPRVSGDEPLVCTPTGVVDLFSPRERG